MPKLWLEEKSDPPVWHHAVERLGSGWWRMACRWELSLRDAGRLWPQKNGEAGPPFEQRCRSCVESIPIQVDAPADVGSVE